MKLLLVWWPNFHEGGGDDVVRWALTFKGGP